MPGEGVKGVGFGGVGLGGEGVRLGGARGPRASVPGGVGGRGTGPRDGANFATCVVFSLFLTRTKISKMGYAPELAWWTGGVDQGP